MTMYAGVVDLRTYLKITSASDDVLLSEMLEAATTAIEAYCRRVFVAASATRYYDASCVDGDTLWLDGEVCSVSKLLNGDADATEITSYYLLPRNTPPYHQIKLKSSQSWDFTTDGEIAVTAMWGYSTTPPADIEQACIRLAAYYYKQRDAQVFDVTAQPDQGQLIIPKGLPADVKQTLEQYVRHNL